MMRVPVSWLREYVSFDVPIEEVARRLVFASCEVVRIVRRGVPDSDGNLGLYRVGRVLQAGKHPNADRLQLCHVDVGEGEPRQIVCGAWNFGAGATVAVALPGAVMPNGTTLQQTKLRGQLSSGMILAEDELELGPDHSGIMLLPDGLEPGTPLVDVLPISDTVLEIETGFNRPDLTGVYGIAREVAAVTGRELAPVPGSDPVRAGDEPVDVTVADAGACPRYIGRLFRDVRIGESPPWLKARLLAAGMRPISNVVDVTNYVMLALGNPLHAFDHSTLRGGRVVVRRAEPGEELTTLDAARRALDPADLMIADAERSVALAGIMGGEDTEVRADTTDVLLEAANFDPVVVMRSSRRLRMRTEGSTRWEKGVDPYLAEPAAVYATQLIVELTGARWTGDTDVHGELPARPVVRLRPELTDAISGVATPVDRQRTTLERIGFDVADDLAVTVPTWRARDVTRDIDLVEEVARFRLEDVPTTLPTRTEMFGQLTTEQRLRRVVEDVLVGAGLYEAYTDTFVPDDGARDTVRLPEPMSRENAALRKELLPELIAAVRRNVNAGNEGIALFEVGRVFRATGTELPDERWHVAGIVEGGFARAKGVVETLYDALHVAAGFQPTVDVAGRAARTPHGVVLELPPGDIDGTWSAFELELEPLIADVPERIFYRDVITYPAVKEDLAFVVEEAVPAGALVAAAQEAAGEELREMHVFDVYRGPQVGDGRKSVAFRVAFQSSERTLADDDAARLRDRIVDVLGRRFGATLRA